MRIGKGLLLAVGTAVVISMTVAALPTPVKVAKPEFVPGSRVTMKVGQWTIEATVADNPTVNRVRKSNRLTVTPAQAKVPFYRGPYLIRQSAIL